MTIILISTAIFLLILGGGVVIWFAFHTRRLAQGVETAGESIKIERLAFGWRYIILPVAIFFLSIILATFFYHQLPAEVAYRFKPDGSPDRWLSREMAMVWLLIPQFFLTLLAGGIVWGTTKLSTLFRQAERTVVKRVILLMGNMIALPQIILGFAMLDIFSYNAYQMHIIPVWIFALIVMGLGSIVLGIFFILAIRRAWGATH